MFFPPGASSMTTFLVEHRWEERRSEEARELITRMIGMSEGKSLPQGYRLLSVVVNREDRCAECLWEAPGREGLERLVSSTSPPTIHTVSEAELIYDTCTKATTE